MSEVQYVCHKCKKRVDEEKHFIAEDGRILCAECSKGVKPATERQLKILADKGIIR